MKYTSVFALIIACCLCACDTMTGPISTGEFDPLRQPGANKSTAAGNVAFSAGQFVRASMNNTAFFKTLPKGETNADKLLVRGSSMKVISHSESYVKVELDSGEIGFVPTLMLEDPKAPANGSLTQPGEFQVYPPLDNNGMPFPATPPAELPPEGAIPTVIDPDAPSSTVPSSPKPGKEPAPLPPNGD